MSAPTTTPTLSAQDFFSTTLSSSITASDTVIPLNAVPTGTEGFLTIDQDTASKEIIYFNTKGASSVTCPSAALGRGQGGTTAVSHSSGATVKMNLVSQYLTEIQNGHALAANAITADKLATSAITLGYAQATSTFTTTSATAVQVTSLTASVTIPAGGRKVKITAWCGALYNATAGINAVMSIWDGTVGSGTQLAQCYGVSNAAATSNGTVMAVVTPAAGAKTYNVGLYRGSGGTATMEAVATSPMFILVEAI